MDKDPKTQPAADNEPAQGVGRFKQTYRAANGDGSERKEVLLIFDAIGKMVQGTAEVTKVQPFLLPGYDFLDPDDDQDEEGRFPD